MKDTFNHQIAPNSSYITIGDTDFTEFVRTTQEKLAELAELQKEHAEIKRMFLELYYAPGNPGYLKARQSFESQKKT